MESQSIFHNLAFGSLRIQSHAYKTKGFNYTHEKGTSYRLPCDIHDLPLPATSELQQSTVEAQMPP